MTFILLILYRLLEIYDLIILVRCICSFFLNPYSSRFYNIIYSITEPVLRPLRGALNKVFPMGGLDFSPAAAIILIGVLQRCLILISRVF